jgi:hypothetical protein
LTGSQSKRALSRTPVNARLGECFFFIIINAGSSK